jgi:hypothetical protein
VPENSKIASSAIRTSASIIKAVNVMRANRESLNRISFFAVWDILLMKL